MTRKSILYHVTITKHNVLIAEVDLPAFDVRQHVAGHHVDAEGALSGAQAALDTDDPV